MAIRHFTLSFLLVIFLHSPSQAAAKRKLGVIAPLSGPVATWGEDVRNALLFANGRFGENEFEIIWEDDECLGTKAVTAATKLVHVDRVDFAIVVCTESLLASAPVFERNKVLVIAPAATGAAVSAAGDYIFRTWPSDAKAAELLYDYVAARHERFGVLTELRGYSQELKRAFLAAAKDNAHFKLITEDYLSDNSEVRTQLLKLRAAGVQGLLVNPNSAVGFYDILRQIRELQWNVKIYGAYMPGSKAFLNLAGRSADDIVYVDAPSIDTTLTDEGKELLVEYNSSFEPMQSNAFVFPATLEAFRRLVDQSKESGDAHQLLYSGKYHGVFGDYTFDKNGDIEGVRHELVILNHGVPEPLKGN